MRPSRLFGTLELPGQKAYPSKDFDYFNNNPPQPFQKQENIVKPYLSTGQPWNHPSQPMPKDTVDKFPHNKPGTNWKRLSTATGSLKQTAKASNPEMIMNVPGELPLFPDEIKIKAALDGGKVREPSLAKAREVFGGIKMDAIQEVPDLGAKYSESLNEARIQQLRNFGFPEELINEAIREEAKRDVIQALKNPALMTQAKLMAAIEKASEVNEIKNADRRSGEQALGYAASSPGANAGTRAYAAAANAAARSQVFSQLPARTLMRHKRSAMAEIRPELEAEEEEISSGMSGGAMAAELGSANLIGELQGSAGGVSAGKSFSTSGTLRAVALRAAQAEGGGGFAAAREKARMAPSLFPEAMEGSRRIQLQEGPKPEIPARRAGAPGKEYARLARLAAAATGEPIMPSRAGLMDKETSERVLVSSLERGVKQGQFKSLF